MLGSGSQGNYYSVPRGRRVGGEENVEKTNFVFHLDALNGQQSRKGRGLSRQYTAYGVRERENAAKRVNSKSSTLPLHGGKNDQGRNARRQVEGAQLGSRAKRPRARPDLARPVGAGARRLRRPNGHSCFHIRNR